MTLKSTELKDGMTYRLTAGDLYMSNGIDNIRVLRNGKLYGESGKWKGDIDSSSTYHNSVFTLEYPTSIEEAAKILDAHCPGWAATIENLEMSSGLRCVLGQLYGKYRDGMKKLFDIDAILVCCGADKIFGENASNTAWQKQIALRQKTKPKAKNLSFIEAVQAIMDGKKVRTGPNSYIHFHSGRGRLENNFGEPEDIFTFEYTNDWEIYVPTLYSDLKVGDKFRLKQGENQLKALVKTEKDGFAIN